LWGAWIDLNWLKGRSLWQVPVLGARRSFSS
jgi:hypothetical protein